MIKVDEDQLLWSPETVCVSSQRPDIVIYSLQLRKVILIELMCLAEGKNIKEKCSEKISCHEGLVKDCISAGWKVYLFTIEVGACGYVAKKTDINRTAVSSRGEYQRETF